MKSGTKGKLPVGGNPLASLPAIPNPKKEIFMINTTAVNQPRFSFLERLRELDEALNPDPVDVLNQRLDRLEAKRDAIDAINSANPAVPASHE
jgi:hypothetical protein